MAKDDPSRLPFGSADGQPDAGKAKRGGPPNRMNDLPYREWMKFQKSFFRHEPDQGLVERCIYFFTKARWSNRKPSQALIIGFGGFDPKRIPKPRKVTSIADVRFLDLLLDTLQEHVKHKEVYDFVLLDLRQILTSVSQLHSFLGAKSDLLFDCLRMLLKEDRYCGVVVEAGTQAGAGFPLPWSVALASRKHLRLRDEKVGLDEQHASTYYCLFMQAAEDGREGYLFDPFDLRVAEESRAVPPWVIPKPPPRKKNEILHPAKFPETLIEEFIRLFTEPSDTVLDPMAGTGSAVLAAVRTGRNGFGIELSPRYTEIARQRIAAEPVAGLFAGTANVPRGEIIEGDATRLEDILELRQRKFDYAVTSPPYWSMLSNKGSEYQRGRRKKDLPLVYSDDKRDLGNIADYDQFVSALVAVYQEVGRLLKDGGYLTIIVKNVKRDHVVYPLAWDLTFGLSRRGGSFEFVGNTLWCQDDIGLKPFAVGIHWVSNTLHNYCLHFRRVRPEST